MENNLIDLTKDENGNVAVNARDLHTALGAKGRFSRWVSQNFKPFHENEDFTRVTRVTVVNNGAEREIEDYALTLDMAKHLALVSGTQFGFEIRDYFISVEKEYRKIVEQPKDSYMIDDPVERAKRWIEEAEQMKQLETDNVMKDQIIGELQPKADYVDKILESTGTMTITQIAADYGLTAQKLNKLLKEAKLQRQVGKQWVLYANHMNKGYTKSHTINITRTDGSPDTMPQTRWTQKGRLKIHDVLTELGYEAQLTEI